MSSRITPDKPLDFITRGLHEKKIVWTYRINMRLAERSISRDEILKAVDSMEIIEEYVENRYLPIYLLFTRSEKRSLHVLMAADVADDNVRIITAYEPDPNEWDEFLKKRRGKK